MLRDLDLHYEFNNYKYELYLFYELRYNQPLSLSLAHQPMMRMIYIFSTV